jgi:hypothetical protein
MKVTAVQAAPPAFPGSRCAMLGPIEPGHRMARKWTFTAKRWTPLSYLFRHGDAVYLSAVQATRPGAGYLRDLIRGIEGARLRVKVPCPLGHMQAILEHYGFVPHPELHEGFEGAVDVWERAAP